MFTQQIIGLIIIGFFAARLSWQRKNKEINANEFFFWLIFWILAALAIVFLRQIDIFVGRLGFTASGIDVLLYIAVVMMFYFVFRMRIRLAKMESDISKIVREVALKDKQIKD